MRVRNVRRRGGQSVIEMLAGALFFIPIALAAINLSAVVLTASINDHLAKDAARAAANQDQEAVARDAASKTVQSLKKSPIITDVRMDGWTYKTAGEVTVETKMEVRLPAPIPGFEKTTLVARATEAIVAAPADI